MPPPRPLTPSSFTEALGLPSAASSSAMNALYSAALGPIQQARYLALFERFDRASSTGRAPLGWNSAASLLTLNWMALHFMWGAALVYLGLIQGLGLALFGVARSLLNMPSTVEYGLFAGLAIFAFALPGLFGDALIHTEIRKRIGRAIAAAPTLPGACALLEPQASSQPRLKKIAIVNALLLLLLIAAFFLSPPSIWGKASTTAEVAPTLSGKVEQSQPGDPIALPGLLRPAPTPPPPSAEPTATPPAPETAQLPNTPDAPVSAPAPNTTQPAPAAPAVAALPAALPPPTPAPVPAPALAPLPAPTPAPVPAAALTKAEKKGRGQATEQKSNSASVKSTKKAADKASAKLRKKAAAPAPAAAPVATPTEKPAASAPAASGSDSLPMVGTAAGHYLTVGTFAEVGNARRAQAKLLNAGLPAFRQSVTSPKGELIRVRVGPYQSAAEAQKAAQQIRRMGLEAVALRQRGR